MTEKLSLIKDIDLILIDVNAEMTEKLNLIQAKVLILTAQP